MEQNNDPPTHPPGCNLSLDLALLVNTQHVSPPPNALAVVNNSKIITRGSHAFTRQPEYGWGVRKKILAPTASMKLNVESKSRFRIAVFFS